MKKSLAFLIPVIIVARTVVNTGVRMVYPLLPVFSRGLGVSLPMISLALTLRSASGVFGPFLGSIADSRGRKTGMLFGLCLFVAGMGWMALAPSYPAFVVALVLTIIGNFVFIPSMQAFIGDRVPYERRGLVISLTELSWSISFIAGIPLVSWLIARQGWQSPFTWLALMGLLVVGMLAALLPRDPKPAGGQKLLGKNMHLVFSQPMALAGLAMGLGMGTANELINLIFGIWMEDTFQVQIAALAAASAVIGFSELGGEIFVSLFSDRIGKSRAVWIGLLMNCLAVLALPLLGRSLAGALVGLGCLYLTFEFTIVSSLPLMTEILPTARATYMACYIASLSIGRTLGDLAAPPLYQAGQGTTAGYGILFIAVVSAAINLLALAALSYVRRAEKR
ncbi:MAG: MFS transporter [Anaerolineales bacterium]|nr:MFS transporter [Anaerolineales bacterium]